MAIMGCTCVYDPNYRQEAADSGLKDWSKVDPSTYTQCFTDAAIRSKKWCKAGQSIDHTTSALTRNSAAYQGREVQKHRSLHLGNDQLLVVHSRCVGYLTITMRS